LKTRDSLVAPKRRTSAEAGCVKVEIRALLAATEVPNRAARPNAEILGEDMALMLIKCRLNLVFMDEKTEV
jgi:hypothetical protein